MYWNVEVPPLYGLLVQETQAIDFRMSSTKETGALLRVLAGIKPSGKFLEIGTGTGLSACWLLDGMDATSTLTTIDIDQNVLEIAAKYLGKDTRITILCMDALTYLESNNTKYDFIFADFRPGKFTRLDLAVLALNTGGIYVVDDLLPQDTWPEGHSQRIETFRQEISAYHSLTYVFLNWDSGLLIASKK
jgi:predicted O-methyltransferase YrrM